MTRCLTSWSFTLGASARTAPSSAGRVRDRTQVEACDSSSAQELLLAPHELAQNVGGRRRLVRAGLTGAIRTTILT